MIEMTTPAFSAPCALLPWHAAQLVSYARFPTAIDSGVAATGFLGAAAVWLAACGVETTRPKSTMPSRAKAVRLRIECLFMRSGVSCRPAGHFEPVQLFFNPVERIV